MSGPHASHRTPSRPTDEIRVDSRGRMKLKRVVVQLNAMYEDAEPKYGSVFMPGYRHVLDHRIAMDAPSKHAGGHRIAKRTPARRARHAAAAKRSLQGSITAHLDRMALSGPPAAPRP